MPLMRPSATTTRFNVTRESKPTNHLSSSHTPIAIGYFPSYTLGAMTAAQLYEAAKAEMPALEQDLAAVGVLQVLGRGRPKTDALFCHSSTHNTILSFSLVVQHTALTHTTLPHVLDTTGPLHPAPRVAASQGAHPGLPARIA